MEPGGARTNFFDAGSRTSAPALPVYENTPSGDSRRRAETRSWALHGDLVKIVQAMVDSVERSPVPKRLTLGSDAYTLVRAALTERLSALEAQKDIALWTDAS